MKVREDRWEQGSHYHHISGFQGANIPPWREARFYYSGRPAINDLLAYLLPERERQVWMPSHYCDDVVNPIVWAGHSRRYYDGNVEVGFTIPAGEIRPGDIFISNCYFGVDILPAEQVRQVRQRGAVLVEDHSQDPYAERAFASDADYAVASLRKSLPLPDGGVLWSPRHLALPSTQLPNPPVFAPRLGGMLAKRLYLQGEFDHKDVFREWFGASETDFTDAGLWGISSYSLEILQAFDVAGWRQQRAENHRLLSEAITRSDIKVMHRGRSGASPMGLVMLLPNHQAREVLRAHLIAHQIYPVVYWPSIPEIPTELAVHARDFVDRMLFLHMDGRYGKDDMQRIAKVIAAAPGVQEIP